MLDILISIIISFCVCLIIGPFTINLLKKMKFGQKILQIGPKWHNNKTGTPTMGGIIFIVATLIVASIFYKHYEVLLLLIISMGFGAIGFVDDFIKVVLKRNLGLSARQKFLAQLIISIIFIFFIYNKNFIDTEIYIPFSSQTLKLNITTYIFFITFVILATVNSVNLTDGLDGLATAVTLIIVCFFTIVAYILKENNIAVFSASLIGGCMGFFLFNKYPAKVFMGDTGSLFLGGAIAAIAILLKLPLFLIIVGGVYLLETLSVIIQVLSFKLTGKRVFKMSPIHHHFEIIGWKETTIVKVFATVTIILCFAALIIIRTNVISYQIP